MIQKTPIGLDKKWCEQVNVRILRTKDREKIMLPMNSRKGIKVEIEPNGLISNIIGTLGESMAMNGLKRLGYTVKFSRHVCVGDIIIFKNESEAKDFLDWIFSAHYKMSSEYYYKTEEQKKSELFLDEIMNIISRYCIIVEVKSGLGVYGGTFKTSSQIQYKDMISLLRVRVNKAKIGIGELFLSDIDDISKIYENRIKPRNEVKLKEFFQCYKQDIEHK